MDKAVVISEKQVRLKMVELGLNSVRDLSKKLNSMYGIGVHTVYNTLGNGFNSRTLTALTLLFDCHPGDLLELVDKKDEI